MKKRWLILGLILMSSILILLVSTSLVYADTIGPSGTYKWVDPYSKDNNKINSSVRISSGHEFQLGLSEQSGKNLPPLAKKGRDILINTLINLILIYGLIFCLRNYQQKNMKERHLKRILKVVLISIVGYWIDSVALLIGLLLYQLLSIPYLASILIIGVIVFISVGFISYFLIFKQALKNKPAIIAAIIFGLLSNPIWINIYFMSGG